MEKRIVVIGSGLSGTLLANELTASGRVTLLEKGPENACLSPEVVFRGKRLAQVDTFCYGGGGTTNLWHNGLIPIQEKDVTSSEFEEILVDAKPYIDRAAARLFFPEESFADRHGQLAKEFTSLIDGLAVADDGVDCLLYPKKFRKLSPVSAVEAHYLVDALDFLTIDGCVQKIRYSIGRQQYSIAPDIVVVAAGAFGTPGILRKIILSTGNRFSSLGAGLIDHPVGFVGKVRFRKEYARIFARMSISDHGDFISRSAIRLKSECGKYTCCAFFRPALTMSNNLDIYKYKSLLGASSGIERLKHIFSLKLLHPDILAEIVSHLFSVEIPGRTFNIFFVGEQKNGQNSVGYDGEKIVVKWEIDEAEIAVYRQVLEKLSGRLAGIADEINMKTDISSEWLWSEAHHSHTVPVGSGEEDLLDRDLKLKYCRNVYVCDGSVIREHSYANTGLTIGQLALRLASTIRQACEPV